ncbi:MAG TPA: heme-binding domain-containing protein [Bacteriovoracaceae bacterium]|nr:heme-binding domain-containing protein [Bacteriovoracaceae bacterium]
MKTYLFFILTILTGMAFGHGNESHGAKPKNVEVHLPTGLKEPIISEYEKRVRPIFQAKCFNCHSAQTTYPWYHQLPVVGKIINSHIKEARSHVDFTDGFPFKGHGGPTKDLEEIIKVTENDEMPPWYYSPFHNNSKVTHEEKKTIIEWSKNTLKKLKVEAKNEITIP